MKRYDTIKPTFFLLTIAVAIPISILLSEFDSNPIVSLIQLIIGYVFFILIPLAWIIFIAHQYETLNQQGNRKSTWKNTLIPVIVIIVGTLGIVFVSKVGYFGNMDEKRFRDFLFFFTFIIVAGLIAVAVNIARNQNYYSNQVNLNSMSYLLICLIVYLGPIGLAIIHRRLNRIQKELNDKSKTTANIV